MRIARPAVWTAMAVVVVAVLVGLVASSASSTGDADPVARQDDTVTPGCDPGTNPCLPGAAGVAERRVDQLNQRSSQLEVLSGSLYPND